MTTKDPPVRSTLGEWGRPVSTAGSLHRNWIVKRVSTFTGIPTQEFQIAATEYHLRRCRDGSMRQSARSKTRMSRLAMEGMNAMDHRSLVHHATEVFLGCQDKLSRTVRFARVSGGGWGRMAEIDGDDHSTWAAIRPQRVTTARASEKLGANGRSSPVASKVAFGHSTPATPPPFQHRDHAVSNGRDIGLSREAIATGGRAASGTRRGTK